MNIEYYMKLQNAYKTKNNREKELAKVNKNADKHFDDTFDTQDVLVNGNPMQVMIIKDTDGNVNKKKIKTRHNDIIKLGDYVEWNDQIWMVSLLDPDDKTWNRGYMYLCTILLRWIDISGEIIERWVCAEDYTKYSMGETGNNNIVVGDYQYGITLPVDDDTKKLKRGNRFVIDFDDNYPPDTYRLSGKKAYLNDNRYFEKGGLMTITLTYDFFDEERDKLVKLENGTDVWICDYKRDLSDGEQSKPDLPTDTPIELISIVGNEDLKIRFKRTYQISSNSSNINFNEYHWKVVSNFKVYQEITNDNKIILYVRDEEFISSSFLLQLTKNEEVIAEKTITVIEAF